MYQAKDGGPRKVTYRAAFEEITIFIKILKEMLSDCSPDTSQSHTMANLIMT